MPSLLAIVSFVIGTFTGTLLTHSGTPQARRRLFGAVAAVLAVSIGLTLPGWSGGAVGIATLSVAMGMMNTALSHVGALPVSLTFGMIVTILLLGLWPLLVMAPSDAGAEAAGSVPRARCDPVPRSGWARPDGPVLLAQHSPSCACPPLECPDGTVEPCAADCFLSDVPECRCEAWCDADGTPRGRNVCECR